MRDLFKSLNESFDRLVESVEEKYKEVSSKQVKDSDGFLTDYTLYEDTTKEDGEEGKYFCVFGDKEYYTPSEDYHDMDFGSLEEAKSWFEEYSGLDESLKEDAPNNYPGNKRMEFPTDTEAHVWAEENGYEIVKIQYTDGACVAWMSKKRGVGESLKADTKAVSESFSWFETDDAVYCNVNGKLTKHLKAWDNDPNFKYHTVEVPSKEYTSAYRISEYDKGHKNDSLKENIDSHSVDVDKEIEDALNKKDPKRLKFLGWAMSQDNLRLSDIIDRCRDESYRKDCIAEYKKAEQDIEKIRRALRSFDESLKESTDFSYGEFVKVNDEPIEIKYVTGEDSEDDELKPAFEYGGDKYYLDDFVRTHDNPWYSGNVPNYIHGVYAYGYYNPLYIELVDDEHVNVYEEDSRKNESLTEGYEGDYLEGELAEKTDKPSIKDAYDRNKLTIIKFKDRDIYYFEDCPNQIYNLVKREMKKYFPELEYLYDATDRFEKQHPNWGRPIKRNESLKEDARKEWKPNTSWKHINQLLDKVKKNGYKFVNNEREEYQAAHDKADKGGYTPEQRRALRDFHQDMFKYKRENESLKESAFPIDRTLYRKIAAKLLNDSAYESNFDIYDKTEEIMNMFNLSWEEAIRYVKRWLGNNTGSWLSLAGEPRLESLKRKIKKIVGRLNEDQMSDEDRRDSEELWKIWKKLQGMGSKLADPKLTKEQRDLLDKYNIGHFYGDIVDKKYYEPLLPNNSKIKLKAITRQGNINLADRARKIGSRIKADYRYSDDEVGYPVSSYDGVYNDAERAAYNDSISSGVRKMKSALADRKKGYVKIGQEKIDRLLRKESLSRRNTRRHRR